MPPDKQRNSTTKLILALAAGLIALLVLVALIVFAATRATTTDSPSPEPTPPAKTELPATDGMTNVTVKITGCDDCLVRAVWSGFTPDEAPIDPWNSGALAIVNGQVSFVAPVPKTQGLAFELSSPRSQLDFVPVAVTRYEQLTVGAPVTPEAAATSTSAYGCWAGTTMASAELHLTVDWYTGKSLDGTPTTMPRAFFNPGIATFGTPTQAWDGTLGHQNVWSCYPG
jgi:hypothetical protein